MVITHFGDGCFRLQSGERTLLLDPNTNRLKGDVVLKTIAAVDALPEAHEAIFPGEYEIAGVEIRGWGVERESTEKFIKSIYAVLWEDMRFVFLGHLSKPIDDDFTEGMSEPDVLIVPASGGHFLSAAEAAKIAKRLEAGIVIPSFSPKPADFLKAVGEKAEPQEKFVFKKKDVTEKKGRVVVLKSG